MKDTLTEYLLPNEIFLPVPKSSKILIKKKHIKKNEPLYIESGITRTSPISGTLKKVVSKDNYFGQTCVFLNILNDFQEEDKLEGLGNTTTILIQDIKKKIKENLKEEYHTFENLESLVFCGIEEEPFLKNKMMIHKYHKDELLLFLDSLASIFHIPEIKIYLLEEDTESILALEQVIHTYPNMKLYLLPNVYPLAQKKYLRYYLKLKDTEKIIDTELLFSLYYEVVKQRKMDFTYVTFTGDAIENPQVIKVKIGTPLKEVVDEVVTFKNSNYIIFLNGLLTGREDTLENVYLTEDVRAVFFMNPSKSKEVICSSCGKCNMVCPLKQNPYRSVKTNGAYKNKNCVHCGLCTFVCPSNISIEKYLKGEKL